MYLNHVLSKERSIHVHAERKILSSAVQKLSSAV